MGYFAAPCALFGGRYQQEIRQICWFDVCIRTRKTRASLYRPKEKRLSSFRNIHNNAGVVATAVGLLLLTVTSSTFAASKVVEACQTAVDVYESDPKQALEDTRWCVEQIEIAAQDAEARSFKDTVGEYQGGELRKEMILGMSSITRTYSWGSKSVTVQKMGVADESNPLAALGKFAQFAGAGGTRVRYQGNTGTILKQGKETTLTVTMREGGTVIAKSTTIGVDEMDDFVGKYFE